MGTTKIGSIGFYRGYIGKMEKNGNYYLGFRAVALRMRLDSSTRPTLPYLQLPHLSLGLVALAELSQETQIHGEVAFEKRLCKVYGGRESFTR